MGYLQIPRRDLFPKKKVPLQLSRIWVSEAWGGVGKSPAPGMRLGQGYWVRGSSAATSGSLGLTEDSTQAVNLQWGLEIHSLNPISRVCTALCLSTQRCGLHPSWWIWGVPSAHCRAMSHQRAGPVFREVWHMRWDPNWDRCRTRD